MADTDPGTDRQNRRPLVLVVLLVLGVAAAVVLFRDDLIGSPFGDDVDNAGERSSQTAPTFDDTETPSSPTTETVEQPTGDDPAIALEPLVDMAAPSAVVDLGSGPVLVSTLDGRIHEVDLDTGTTEVVLDLSDSVSFGGEQGLLGMAADPDGDRLYVDYTGTDGDTDVRSWPLVDGRPDGGPGDGVLHLELGQPYANHNGGNLVFGPDGLLWIGTGDGGSGGDPGEVAQDPTSLLGKMLRVRPLAEGGIQAPSSNPAWDGRPEIWGIGLRNPWRYSFDRETGRLWIGDVGQNAVEEVTVVEPDAPMPNFGWDDLEGTRPFEGTDDPAFTDPAFDYLHEETGGCSVTGGYVYRGDDIESLYGWYLFGDFCGGWIRAVPADDPGTEPVELVAPDDPGAGEALSFAELRDGELLFLTQDGIARIVAG